MNNPFFKNTGPHNISHLLKNIDLLDQNFSDEKVQDIKDLHSSEREEITFFHSKKYEYLAKVTKASFCLTTENLSQFYLKHVNL